MLDSPDPKNANPSAKPSNRVGQTGSADQSEAAVGTENQGRAACGTEISGDGSAIHRSVKTQGAPCRFFENRETMLELAVQQVMSRLSMVLLNEVQILSRQATLLAVEFGGNSLDQDSERSAAVSLSHVVRATIAREYPDAWDRAALECLATGHRCGENSGQPADAAPNASLEPAVHAQPDHSNPLAGLHAAYSDSARLQADVRARVSRLLSNAWTNESSDGAE